MFSNKITRLALELTSICNLACPLCIRTRKPELTETLKSIDYDALIRVIKDPLLDNLFQITMVGNIGDPIGYPKFIELLKEINTIKPNVIISISTNGALKTTKFWSELANIKNLHVRFAIDGLEDTNHIYRVGANWDKLMNNIKAFINNGGHARWVFIPFAHNEHQVDEAKMLANELGFKKFSITRTTNTKDTLKNKKLAATYITGGLVEKKIDCQAERLGEIYINSDNAVLPCCWTSAVYHQNNRKSFHELINFENDITKASISKIYDNFYDIEDVVRLHWDERKIRVCCRQCGSNKTHTNEDY